MRSACPRTTAPPDAEKRERYITPEMKAFEDKALSPRTGRWQGEMAVRAGVIELAPHIEDLQQRARALALLDGWAPSPRPRHATTTAARSSQTNRRPHRGRPPPGGGTEVDSFIATTRGCRHAPHVLITAQHGRQVHYMRQVALIVLLAPTARLRAGARGTPRAGGCHPPALALPTTWPRALHVHGGDDRGRRHPQRRHRPKPGVDDRSPRHRHLRRHGTGLRHRPPPDREEPQLQPVLTHYFELTQWPRTSRLRHGHLDAVDTATGIVSCTPGRVRRAAVRHPGGGARRRAAPVVRDAKAPCRPWKRAR